ncbi:MAG: NAD(+) synthase, partial [Caldilineae bacterium]
MNGPFHSIYSHGFVRAAVCVPFVRVADPAFNTDRTLALARQASERQAAVALFPEMGVSSYALDDLFHQDALLEATIAGVERIVDASRELTPVLLVG